MSKRFRFTDTDKKVLARFVKSPEHLLSGIEWIVSGNLTEVSQTTAFQLVRGGAEVFGIDLSGVDFILDQDDTHHFTEETETMYVVEGAL